MRATVALAAVVCALVLTPTAAFADEVYVTGQIDNALGVLDSDSGSMVATVPLGAMPYWVAVSPDGRRAYVTAVVNNSVIVVDTESRIVVDTFPTGAGAYQIAVSPDGERVYVGAYSSQALFVHSAETGAVLESIPLPGGPRAIAVSPDGETAYAALFATDELAVVDLDDGSVETHPVGDQPTAVATAPDGSRVYVGAAGTRLPGGHGPGVAVFDTTTGVVVDEIDAEGPFGLAVAPDGSRAFGIVTKIEKLDLATASSLGSTALGPHLVSVAVSPDGQRAYVTTADYGNPVTRVIDADDLSVLDQIDSLAVQAGVAVRPNVAPTASFTVEPAEPGEPTQFDATESSDPEGEVARYDWDFGDGTVLADAGPTPTHSYGDYGDYDVTLTVTDDGGCSVEVVYTGQTASCGGGPQATSQRTVALVSPGAPPTCRVSSLTVLQGTPTLIGIDCSGEIDSVAVASPPLHGALSQPDQTDRTVVYTPATGFVGTDRFRVLATGPGGDSAPATIAVTVARQLPPTGSSSDAAPPTGPREVVARRTSAHLRITAARVDSRRSMTVVRGRLAREARGLVAVTIHATVAGSPRRQLAFARILRGGRFRAVARIPRAWRTRYRARLAVVRFGGSDEVGRARAIRRVLTGTHGTPRALGGLDRPAGVGALAPAASGGLVAPAASPFQPR